MTGKLANTCLVVVLIVGFSLYVAGLGRSTAPEKEPVAVAASSEELQPHETQEGVTVYPEGTEPGAADTTTEVVDTSTGAPEEPSPRADATPTRTPTPINIGNFVWDDIDRDGRQDAGEPGLAGITVQLWNSAKTQLIHQTTTNASGNYTVVAPTPGDYRVRVIAAAAGDQFSPKDAAGGDNQLDSDINPTGANASFTDVFTIASNVISITTIDAGIIRFVTPTPTRTPTPVNIGNFVWDDIDRDGRQDAGEPGLAGITVQLWNSAKTQLIHQTTTNSSGNYTLIAPRPGDYRVRVIAATAGDQFSPKDNAAAGDQLDSDINPTGTNAGFTDVYSIASNVISITTIDAGIIRFVTPTPTRTPTPINIGNFVWHDTDGDGEQDPGEPGIAGVRVQLWNSAKTQLIHQTTTNASGNYTVVAPIPGDYRVRVLLPAGTTDYSPKDAAGGDNLLDSDINPSGGNRGFTDVFTIASNVISITTVDAGITGTLDPTPPVEVGNFVWHDEDEDGEQDPGEPGFAGVTVQLTSVDKATVIDEDTTDVGGVYSLVAPGPGNYRVRVDLPPGAASFSPKDGAGGDTFDDSDVNPSGPDVGYTDVFTLAPGVTTFLTVDAGIVDTVPTPVAVGDFVWDDTDGDGEQDAGEPGIVGVSVELTSADKVTVIDEDTTDGGGLYTLAAPGPGDYRVRVVLPPGAASFSPEDGAGGDTFDDSDVNPSGPDVGYTDVFTLVPGVTDFLSVDAGVIVSPPASPTPTPDPSVTPTPDPSVTPTPDPSATPTPGPSASPTPTLPGDVLGGSSVPGGGPGAGPGGGGDAGGGALPRTGATRVGQVLLLGIVVVSVGVALTLLSRRRSA